MRSNRPPVHEPLSRRGFLVRASVGVATLASASAVAAAIARAAHALPADRLRAAPASLPAERMGAIAPDGHAKHALMNQDGAQQPGTTAGVVNMEGEFYKSVRLPPKPNATPQLTKQQVDDFERTIACPCPCTLDVFTCRTTDFNCANSPAVHRDVQDLVAGGYSADEIMQALRGTYGNVILMAPPKKGVNLIAWFAPFAALGAGAMVVHAMLRGWRRNSQAAVERVIASSSTRMPDVKATDEEMARLQAVLRDDGQ